jgi:hypothetical protein
MSKETPKYLKKVEQNWRETDVQKRTKRSETSALLEPFVALILQHFNGLGLCHAITESQSFWRLASGCPGAIASKKERRAVAPANWNVWVMMPHQSSVHQQQVAEFCSSVVKLIERDPILQRRRMYVVDRDNEDRPFPSRQIGIALDWPEDVYIDLRFMSMGPLFKCPAFEKAYLDGSFLNLAGCLTLIETIDGKRLEKGYNIDALWHATFDRYLHAVGIRNVSSLYQVLVESFQKVFAGTDFLDRNKKVVGKLLISSLRFVRGGEAAMDECQTKLVESLRPVINATIASIDSHLGGGTFVVGGNAMRRYVRSIVISKDIDSKVYIPNGKNMGESVEIVKEVASKATALLIGIKDSILPENERRLVGGVPFSACYRDPNADDLQFRLRYSPEQENGRPRLISIDYKMIIRIGNYDFKHVIAVLDVVIQRLPSHAETSEGRVASLAWIIDDLRSTWEATPHASQRLWAGKREKDMSRFRELDKVLGGSAEFGMSARVDQLGVTSRPFLEYLDNDARPSVIRDYSSLFAWCEKGRGQEVKKQKVTFSKRELDRWRSRCGAACII